MRWRRLVAEGLKPFDRVDLDIESIPGKIVAVVGLNGAGKSMLLNLLPGGVFGKLPTPDNDRVASLVDGSAATLSVWVDDVVLRHRYTKTSGKHWVEDAQGQTLTPGGRQADFDEWVAKHLIPKQVVYAGPFAAQGGGRGILDLDPAECTAVLLRAMGISQLEDMATQASAEAEKAKRELSKLVARIDEARLATDSEASTAAVLARKELELSQASEKVRIADEAVQVASDNLSRAKAQQELAQQQRQRLEEYLSRRNKLKATRGNLESRIEALGTDMRMDDSLLRRETAIDRAMVEREEAARKRHELLVEKGSLDAAMRAAIDDGTAKAKALEGAQQRLLAAVKRVADAKAKLVGRDLVEQAATQMPILSAEVERAEQDVVAAEEALRGLAEQQVVGADVRISHLREGLQTAAIAETLDSATYAASSTLMSDDEMVEQAQVLPRKLAEARESLRLAKLAERTATTKLRDAERLAARAEDLKHAQQQLARFEADVSAGHTEVLQAEAALAAARSSYRDMQERSKRLSATIGSHIVCDDCLREHESLIKAKARRERLLESIEHAKTSLSEVEHELSSLGPQPAKPDDVDLVAEGRAFTVAVSARTIAQEEHQEIVNQVGRLQARLQAEEDQRRRIEELEQQRLQVSSDVEQWLILARDLGRKGLQSMLIDLRSPELTDMINSLLHSCVSSRFAVSIETQQESSSGEMIDKLVPMVLDTETGERRSAHKFSGGERVLLGEAVALGLSVMACRQANLTDVVLVRDETGAALDVEKAPRYVDMLRVAADMVGASKVLFVAHNENAWSRADCMVRVDNGNVEVVQ